MPSTLVRFSLFYNFYVFSIIVDENFKRWILLYQRIWRKEDQIKSASYVSIARYGIYKREMRFNSWVSKKSFVETKKNVFVQKNRDLFVFVLFNLFTYAKCGWWSLRQMIHNWVRVNISIKQREIQKSHSSAYNALTLYRTISN